MKFVKQHAILIAVAVAVYFIFFSQSGANAVFKLNQTLNVNPNGTAAGS
jgi:hypothetical protein